MKDTNLDSLDFEPITGNIDKIERKFTVTKPHLIYDYLNDYAEYLHHYVIEQKQVDDTKYRMYIHGENRYYTKHNLQNRSGVKKEIHIDSITREEYEAIESINAVRKIRYAYRISTTNLILNLDILGQDRYLVEVWKISSGYDRELLEFKAPKGMEEVTDIEYFGYGYVAQNPDNIMTRRQVIFEGTDLIGKTTALRELIKSGYMCLDRDQYNFSNYVTLVDKPIICADKIRNAYAGKKDYVIVLMYTSNPSILGQRLMIDRQGSASSKYDMQCIEYNEVYMQILKHIQSFGMGVVGVDIHNKSLKEIEDEILRGIEEIDKTNRTSII